MNHKTLKGFMTLRASALHASLKIAGAIFRRLVRVRIPVRHIRQKPLNERLLAYMADRTGLEPVFACKPVLHRELLLFIINSLQG